MKKDNILKEKSFAFALRVVKLYQYLKEQKGEYVLSKQLLRCGTSIGANVRESEYAESKADFVHKLSISLKEANETDYWIELLYRSDILDEAQYTSIEKDIKELIKLLTAIVVSTKRKMNKN